MYRHFQHAGQHNCDAFVADYTEATKYDKIKRGVEIMHEKPKGIDAFHLSNPYAHPYWAINFEQHKSYFDGKSNCECMFSAIRNDSKKKWALLVELKYCQAKKRNLKLNAKKAWKQLLSTHTILKDKGCIDCSYNVYFNISMPPHTSQTPFTSFLCTSVDINEMKKKYNIIPLGYNHIVIATPAFLKLPKEEV